MDFVFGFGVAYGYDGSAQKARGIEALLARVIAGVCYREGRPAEYLLGMRKIKTVLFQVGRALGCIPREFHGIHYTYDNMYSSGDRNGL